MTVCIHRNGWAKPFLITCDDERIIEFFVRSHDGIVCDGNGIDGTRIEVTSCGASFLVRCSGHTVTTDAPIQTVLNLMFEGAVYRSDLFPLHGGAIEVSGTACLFLASTHVGKTTLIAYLTQSGYPYINDDHSLIDTDTLFVAADITPLHLRPESLPILERYGCTINGAVMKTEKIDRIIYTPEHTASADLPIGHIFFIDRSETENSCSPIEKSEAVKLLMAGLISPKAADIKRLQCAIKIATKCKRLVYSDMRYVVDLLRGDIN